ncbi:MAG: arginine repressor [Phycisphaerales bacterium]|nr:arginine repressor [Phycisphaerales bacterium]
MVTKTQRHHRILRIISVERPANQGELVRHLARVGIDATQATLSRDLRELGVVKSRSGYQTLSDPTAPGAPDRPAIFTAALRRLLVKVSHGGTQVILRTPPGQASALAIEIDRASDAGILRGALGTIAGDDCIFVACASISAGRVLARQLEGIAHERASQANQKLVRALA